MGWAGIRKKLFGDYIEVVIHGFDKRKGHKILKGAYKEALRLQKIFNFYDKSSNLYKLNVKRKMKVPQELIWVLKEALKLCKETKGAYDISHGANFLRRKNGANLEKLGCNYKHIKISGQIVEIIDDTALIDLGSIAKGYIGDKIGEYLEKNGVSDFIIDARGDVLVKGQGQPAVRIQHPRKNGEFIMSIKPVDMGVATSGDYNQYTESFDDSHILNAKRYSSVTVVAPTLTEADLYATVFSVINEKEIKRIIKNKKRMGAFIIDKKMKMKYYGKFKEIVDGTRR